MWAGGGPYIHFSGFSACGELFLMNFSHSVLLLRFQFHFISVYGQMPPLPFFAPVEKVQQQEIFPATK